MSYETIRHIKNVATGISTIALHRPDSFNALSDEMVEELLDVFKHIKHQVEVRVVVIKGEGKAFCAGGDVKQMIRGYGENPSMLKHMDRVNEMVFELINLPKPVICAVNGVATGAGVNIALASDIIIAADNARFSEIFGQVGLVPDCGGAYLLPRIVGRNKAKELVFTQEIIDAQEAYRIGLVNKIVPKESLETETNDFAEKLAAGPPLAMALAKRMLNISFESDCKTMLDYEAFCQIVAYKSDEHAEGVNAFAEKRAPVFKK